MLCFFKRATFMLFSVFYTFTPFMLAIFTLLEDFVQLLRVELSNFYVNCSNSKGCFPLSRFSHARVRT